MKYNREEVREKFKDLFEYSLDLIYVNDMRGNFLDANDIALNKLGFKREEITDISFIDLIDKENLMRAIKITNEIRKSGKQSKRSEYKLKTKAGKFIYVETYAIPLKRNDKIYAILGIGNDITARKLAEQKLRESEAEFRNIIEAIPDTFYLLSADSTILECRNYDPKTEIFFKPQYLGKKAQEFLPIELAKIVVENVNKAIKTQESQTVEFTTYIGGDIFTAEGRFLYLSQDRVGLFLRTITEKKKLEIELRKSEEKFRHLFQSSPFFIGLVDLEGKLIDCNEVVNTLLSGHTKDDIIGKDFREIFSMNEKNKVIIPALVKYFKSLLKGELKDSIEFKLYRSIGDFLWLKLHGSLIKIQEKNLVQFIIVNITETKKAEQQIKESEERYRNLFEDSPFSLVLLNSKGKIIDCNPATENLIGYKKEDLISKNFRKLPIFHPDSLPLLFELFDRFLKGEELHRMDIELYKKDGSLVWVNLQASLVKLGENTYVQTTFQDVSRRKAADFLIEEEVKKLKELDQIRKDLISRVSHELKTPLVSVCGGSELLLDFYKNKLEKEELELVSLIQRGGKRLRHLVNNLLDISRIEYNKFKLEKEKCDLSKIVREISNEMKYLVKQRKLFLNLELPGSLFLDLDRIRFEQVITNLLLNAIKNTPPMGNITITLQQNENWAEFSVSDTGVGLTKQEMDRIFTRFGKIERYGDGLEDIDAQGSGLGLFISMEIVDLHGGIIRAESQGRHMGSNFIVKLPIN
jgi:PAS domain S-box-containing protein